MTTNQPRLRTSGPLAVSLRRQGPWNSPTASSQPGARYARHRERPGQAHVGTRRLRHHLDLYVRACGGQMLKPPSRRAARALVQHRLIKQDPAGPAAHRGFDQILRASSDQLDATTRHRSHLPAVISRHGPVRYASQCPTGPAQSRYRRPVVRPDQRRPYLVSHDSRHPAG